LKERKNSLFMLEGEDKTGEMDVYENRADNSFIGLDQNNEFNLGLGNSAENNFNHNDLLDVS
jgi:hypothetical protein